MKINAIKANGVEYDIWATESDVQALNNQGNAALGREVESGKQEIAQAINAKGGIASADESMAELADDVLGIPVNVQVEDAANLAFPESIAWNILKEAYAQQRVGYASWIVAEFFKGYDTIPLSGADAFYTCDGDFYTEATTHTWHDDEYNKVNRFVVYYFVGENVPFSVTQESLCPRSMAVMGKFGSINIASAGRIRQIYNGGTINDISFASKNPWCDEVLLAGVKEHNSGYLLYNNNNVQMFASDIEVLNGGYPLNNYSNANLTVVSFPRLKYINGGELFGRVSSGTFPALSQVQCPLLKTIKGNSIVFNSYYGTTYQCLIDIEFPELEEIADNAYLFFSNYNVEQLTTTKTIKLPKFTRNKNNGIFIQAIGVGPNLMLLEIGQDYNGNLNLRYWSATNAIKDTDNSLVDEGETFANNREKFLYNFEKYIVDKLADNSESGLSFTLTLKSAVYAVVSTTQSITDKLTAKHWNLASA